VRWRGRDYASAIVEGASQAIGHGFQLVDGYRLKIWVFAEKFHNYIVIFLRLARARGVDEPASRANCRGRVGRDRQLFLGVTFQVSRLPSPTDFWITP
jgi:hypothetical protein